MFKYKKHLLIPESTCQKVDRRLCWAFVIWKSLLQEEVLEVGLVTSRLEDLIIKTAGGRADVKAGMFRRPLNHDE